MSDIARTFFDSIKTLDDIQRLIDDEVRESVTVEYKAGSYKFEDKTKNEIAKDVSAFANSGGGVIIYGVETDSGNDRSKPVRICGILETNIESFDRVVNSRIRREIEGLEKKFIKDGGMTVMVVHIPQSMHSPHQSLVDNKYYHRAASQSIPMEHHLVELHFGRRHGPLLHVEIKATLPAQKIINDYSEEIPLLMIVKNQGKRLARDIMIHFTLPKIEFVQMAGWELLMENISDLYDEKGKQCFQQRLDGVIYQGISAAFAQPTIKIHRDFISQHCDAPVIEWVIFGDDMEAKGGKVTLQSLGILLQPT